MDNGNGLGVADVAALSGGGFGGWNNGFEGLIYLAVIASMFGGGNWFGNGGGNNANAIQADVNRGFDNQNLQAQTRDILAAVTGGTAQAVAATNQVYHDIVGNLGDKYYELARDVAGVASGVQTAIANQNECCCGTKMLIAETGAQLSAQIAQNKYENALALAGMEQRLTSKMDANEITALRDKVQRLELAEATNGMLRFPNSWSYGAGPFPPIFGGCGCNN